jgi:hypothetical protein
MRRLSYNGIIVSAGSTTFRPDSCTVTASDNNTTFTVDMRKLEAIPGTHQLTIVASALKDTDRQPGVGEYTISWNENIAAKTLIEMAVSPDAAAGSIDKQTDNYDYGILTLKATPAQGYRFDYWQSEGKVIARTETLDYEVTGAATLRAVFVPIDCRVVVDCDQDYGIITGFTSGTYACGEELMLSAVPAQGYVLSHWLCDGEVFSENAAIRIQADGDHTYTAVFVEETTGVRDVSTPTAVTDTYWYTLQGVRIGQHTPALPGVYIHCGKIVRVK